MVVVDVVDVVDVVEVVVDVVVVGDNVVVVVVGGKGDVEDDARQEGVWENVVRIFWLVTVGNTVVDVTNIVDDPISLASFKWGPAESLQCKIS